MEHFGFPLEVLFIFFGVIALSVYLDLRAHRGVDEISLKDAGLWSMFWIGLSFAFYGYLWVRFDQAYADLFLAGYVLEKTLSVDNLMVFIAIFSSFAIKGALQHRILYWGIIGALVFRAIFVVIGTSLFLLSPWVGFIFAAAVAWSAWAMMTASDAEDEIEDYTDHWSVRMVKRVLPVFPRLHHGKFLLSRKQVEQRIEEDPSIELQGKAGSKALWYATPALLCLLAIETSDIMFAFDSVPAVIAITQEPLLVYAAMIFAILGLRSLYFVLAALTRYMVHLEKAVIVLLYFIAAKLALQSWNHVFGDTGIHISPSASLYIVFGILTLGVVASLLFPERDQPTAETATENETTR
ncbi:tellurium resistance protein TerC [Lamprobacter modestohalophilus]|uniref:Tellurium resistance protein TerC n=1 Tax=Lamprobacter modestohalophilus TaxID=1064514 RepID=A0A9X0WAV6_9GAMM|nr:TerC/Alx family metal homeostasis membrane protein [Lamprobacter modestohalophilus]MBK1619518.1 tellurium resistance protein TerC [Lamprobacter modestohalophilus]MCF7978586.1 TerC/Alx family metal homeostasis membrane protein [Chromatiaceae bacterium]MCF7995988.1 TerC/Alx family metal homeostasis membrane protein [Chromatiaceae bacterium]MCF8016092.1 TerC/Alx family metal homeostasis membrane protein [Chromatiaceae bacterium]